MQSGKKTNEVKWKPPVERVNPNLFKSLEKNTVVESVYADTINAAPVDSHYTRLYSARHFRNRVIRLQQMCQDLGLDAITIICGVDARNDSEMTKLLNWLIFGASCSDIHGSSRSNDFDDSFFVVGKDSLQIYTNTAGFKHLKSLVSLIQNCNMYMLTKADRENQELQEVIKVSKFYEYVHDKSVVGMPVRQVTVMDVKANNEAQIVEQWPIIQAYGLDLVGNGFFTMKHKFQNLREQLSVVYKEYDSFSFFRLVFDEIPRFNKIYFDAMFNINRKTAEKRQQQMTEEALFEGFKVRAEMSKMMKTSCLMEMPKDGLPVGRVLCGPNRTNMVFDIESDKDAKLWKYNNADGKHSCLHATYEYADVATGMRWCRTFFLNSLVAGEDNYLKNIHFTDDEDLRQPSEAGLVHQKNSAQMLNMYFALVRTHEIISRKFMHGDITSADLVEQSQAEFTKQLKESGVDYKKALPKAMKHFQVDLRQFDSYGEVTSASPSVDPKALVCLRMQIWGIQSQHDDSQLGSLIFANSYIQMDVKNYVTLTENIPVLQAWHTNENHYMNMRVPILTEKNLNSEEHFGDRTMGDFFEDVLGFLPTQERYLPLLTHDSVLFGKLMFYAKGFIYTDQRLGAFVVPYSQLESITIHQSEEQNWIKFAMRQGTDLLPAGLVAQNHFYIRMSDQFCQERFATWTKMFRDQSLDTVPSLLKEFDKCPRVTDSFSMLNFDKNRLQYNSVYGSEYTNFEFWQEKTFTELLDFHAIQEFNQLKQKPFTSFAQFSETYRLVMNKPPAAVLEDTLSQMSAKLKRQQGQPISLILVSGIPGSGKGRFASSLSKLLMNEKLTCQDFKMSSVQASCKYSTPDFVQALQKEVVDPNVDVVVAVLPSYHHLKKAIFELRKNDQFVAQFDIKFVITKVSANNFYQSRNRNLYPYLIENCLKGVCHAVVFEHSTQGGLAQAEIDIMTNMLQTANFANGILPVHGRHHFDLEYLSQILMRSNEKFNMLYTKNFYGFEKEGSCSAYRDASSITGHYFNYRYPIRQDMIDSTLRKMLNRPIWSDAIKALIPKNELELEAEELAKQKEAARVEALEPKERRRYDREQRKKEQQEADKESEKLLLERMELTKRMVQSAKSGSTDLVYEHIRGLVRIEDESGDSTTDYQLIVNANEISLKPMKNQDKRLAPEDLGILMYGRNIANDNEALTRALLKTCRTQIKVERPTRELDELKTSEVDKITEESMQKDLPSGWQYDGRCFMTFDGDRLYHHPQLNEFLMEYLNQENDKIKAYNEQIRTTVAYELANYETPV